MNGLVFIQLQAAGCVIEPCGSRVTCNPPPTDTDADYRVHYRYEDHDRVVRIIQENAFEPEGGTHYNDSTGDFHSWRLGEINLLISANDQWIGRHRLATELCRMLNIMDKQTRIAVFQRVLYDAEYPVKAEKDFPF